MPNDYGLWPLVIISSLVFIVFAFSFVRPKTSRDWRSLSGFSAFIVALFTEMYGFPLTIYLLSGWLQSKFPGMNIYSHDMGHLLEQFFGWGGNPHFGPFHIVSIILIFGGSCFSRMLGEYCMRLNANILLPLPAPTPASATPNMLPL